MTHKFENPQTLENFRTKFCDEYTTLTKVESFDNISEFSYPSEDFIELIQDGDTIYNYYWNAGLLAKRYGYILVRNDEVLYECLVWLS